MQFLHFSDTIIITVDDENYTIHASDIRYEKLVKLISLPDYTDEDVKDILTLKFSSKIKHAGIKDGQFVINNEIVPSPFSTFLLNFKDSPELFEFYYNLYFSLTKRDDVKELTIWRDLLNNGTGLKPFSLKEEKILALYNYSLKSKYFIGVSSFVTEEDLQNFVKSNFKKNLYKTLKNYVFSLPELSWYALKSNLTFLSRFKDNEDKFFQEIEDVKGLGVAYQYITNERQQGELVDLLKSLQVVNLTHLKKFFGGLEDLFPKLNQLHIIARDIAAFNDLYAQEVFFQDYSKLNYEIFSTILNNKIREWKSKHEDAYSRTYFKLEERHPWLLDLKKYETSNYGECAFITPSRGIDLDIWSNTMNHCIRTYKQSQSSSQAMILLSIINTERLMISTLELSIDYSRNDLKIQQFVGYANEQMQNIDPNFYADSIKELKTAFYDYCRKNGKEELHLEDI